MNLIIEELKRILEREKQICLYSAGPVSFNILCYLKAMNIYNVRVVDRNNAIVGTDFHGVVVESLEILNSLSMSVIITCSAIQEVSKYLEEQGFIYNKSYFTLQGLQRNKKCNYYDPILGYNRIDEVCGFKKYLGEDPNNKIVILGDSVCDYSVSFIKSWPEYLWEMDEKSYTLYNGGIYSYFSGQLLLKLIRDVIPIMPHQVIVYSGITDSLYQGSKNLVVADYVRRVTDDLAKEENTRKVLKNPFSGIVYGDNHNLSNADIWIYNLRMMEAICKEFGIEFICILCPCMLIGGYLISDIEKKMIGLRYSEIELVELRAFYEKIEEYIVNKKNYYDFTDIFSGMSGIYYDICHVNEDGNRIIAEKIKSILDD